MNPLSQSSGAGLGGQSSISGQGQAAASSSSSESSKTSSARSSTFSRLSGVSRGGVGNRVESAASDIGARELRSSQDSPRASRELRGSASRDPGKSSVIAKALGRIGSAIRSLGKNLHSSSSAPSSADERTELSDTATRSRPEVPRLRLGGLNRGRDESSAATPARTRAAPEDEQVDRSEAKRMKGSYDIVGASPKGRSSSKFGDMDNVLNAYSKQSRLSEMEGESHQPAAAGARAPRPDFEARERSDSIDIGHPTDMDVVSISAGAEEVPVSPALSAANEASSGVSERLLPYVGKQAVPLGYSQMDVAANLIKSLGRLPTGSSSSSSRGNPASASLAKEALSALDKCQQEGLPKHEILGLLNQVKQLPGASKAFSKEISDLEGKLQGPDQQLSPQAMVHQIALGNTYTFAHSDLSLEDLMPHIRGDLEALQGLTDNSSVQARANLEKYASEGFAHSAAKFELEMMSAFFRRGDNTQTGFKLSDKGQLVEVPVSELTAKDAIDVISRFSRRTNEAVITYRQDMDKLRINPPFVKMTSGEALEVVQYNMLNHPSIAAFKGRPEVLQAILASSTAVTSAGLYAAEGKEVWGGDFAKDIMARVRDLGERFDNSAVLSELGTVNARYGEQGEAVQEIFSTLSRQIAEYQADPVSSYRAAAERSIAVNQQKLAQTEQGVNALVRGNHDAAMGALLLKFEGELGIASTLGDIQQTFNGLQEVIKGAQARIERGEQYRDMNAYADTSPLNSTLNNISLNLEAALEAEKKLPPEQQNPERLEVLSYLKENAEAVGGYVQTQVAILVQNTKLGAGNPPGERELKSIPGTVLKADASVDESKLRGALLDVLKEASKASRNDELLGEVRALATQSQLTSMEFLRAFNGLLNRV